LIEILILKEKNKSLENQLQIACWYLQQQTNRNKQLADRVKELEVQLTQRPALRATGKLDDPFIGNPSGGNLRYSPPGVVSPFPVHPGRLGRSYTPLSPSATPYTPTAYRESLDPPVMVNLTPAVRRHKRTETPEQLSLRKFTKGMPIYTFGIDPQNDRGLLHDFFEDVRKWAALHTKRMDAQEADNCSKFPDLVDMMGGKSDIKQLLMDHEMHKDIVASLVSRHIVMNAMGEHFLWNSGHHAGDMCNDLFLEFAHLVEEEYGRKHEVCEKQQTLYTKLKLLPGHKKWRTYKAEACSQDLLEMLAFSLDPSPDPERAHVLSELYVKGYRIGFRLRMEAVKWQVIWPTAGTDLNLGMMVNQTRNLLGDPMETLNGLQSEPKKFLVRFALTPTMTKFDYSSGVEERTVVHSAMVHVGRKGVFSHKADAGK
jgi:hypothetical protein